MAGHWFNRAPSEQLRWHSRISVYFGGFQSDAFCSGKLRAHAAFVWKELGLVFRRCIGAGK